MDQSLFGLAFIAVFALLIIAIKKLIVDKYIIKAYWNRSVSKGTLLHNILITLLPLATIGLAYVTYQDAIFIRNIFETSEIQGWLIGLGVAASFVPTGIALAPAILYVIVSTKLEREHTLKGKTLIYAKYFFMIAVIVHILLSLYLVFIF